MNWITGYRLWFAVFFCLPILFADLACPQTQPTRQHDFALISDSLATDVPCNKAILVQDFCTYVGAPLQWRHGSLNQILIFSAVGGALFSSDQFWQDRLQERRSHGTNQLSDFVRLLGDGRYTLPMLGIGYLVGWQRNDLQLRCTAVTAVESFFLANAVTTGLKFLTHRHRPYTGDSPYHWDGLNLDFTNAHLSMPSGHATTAFAVVTVVASVYNRPIIVPVLLYSLATLTAWSRVNDNVHWTSDVFVGSAIGYFTGRFLHRRHLGSGKKANFSIICDKNRLSFMIRF